MKKILIPIGTLLLSGLVYGQLSPTENYVDTKTYLDYYGTTASKTAETVQYFDGLGRRKQIVNIKASPLGNDVVTHIEYDAFGRQVKDYLPVPQGFSANGSIFTAPLDIASNPDIYGSEKIYSERILENSPLDRIQQQIQVGNDWTAKPVKFDYDANDGTADRVGNFVTTTTWLENATKTIARTSLNVFYGTAQLYKNTVTDEDGNKTIEFKNGQGQTILVRKVLSATENADTYYIYNEYNQLAIVVPPKAAFAFLEEYGAGSDEEIPSDILNDFCYQYRYDGRNRLVEKKLPGKGWEYMVYDKADRLVATQDANQKLLNKWFFTKYDKFGRILYTGIAIDNGNRNAVQSWITNTYGTNIETAGTYTQSGLQIYYANTAYPQNIESILSVNYYDTYPIGTPAIPTQILGQNVLSQDAQNSNISTKSLPVASYVKNIEDDNWTKNYTWYDTKGRAIGTHSINHLGGYTKTESELDFSGTPKMAITRHKRLDSDTERVITENFTYDHQNRLLTHTHKVDNNAVEYLAQNKYNELSQLEYKKVGGTVLGNGLQTVDYQYNIRGWMTQINNPANLGNDLFGYKMSYNLPSTDYWTQRYNGNISEIDWATQNDNVLRRYVYMYDSLNRLTGGYYLEPNSSIVWAGNFNEYYNYDLNGNITKLTRTGKPPASQTTSLTIDDLTYIYDGNRLSSISDAAQNYSGYPGGGGTITYDLNGNMNKHPDKGLTKIDYNFLNLPNNIVTNNNKSPFGNNTSYLYSADGTKLRKNFSYYKLDFMGNISTLGTSTDYLNGFQYVLETGGVWCIGCPAPSPALQFIPTSEGYFDFVKNKYIYSYSDHLGNTRLSYFHNGSSIEVLEENNYYPFGLKHEGYNALAGNPSYQYKYNGKELQETGMYDYGARFYMPDIGRWGVVDPLAETNRRFNPYNYAINNPLRFIDPDGRSQLDWVRRTGQSNWEYNSKITSAQQATDAGYVSYANGRGDANSTYTTSIAQNGVDTGVTKTVTLGEGGNWSASVGGNLVESGTAKDSYINTKPIDDFSKFMAGFLLTPSAIITGGAGWAALGEVGSGSSIGILGGQTTGSYLQGAAIRGATDLSTQAFFKGAENIDGRQLLINTFVGGGNGFRSMGKMALTNLSLNTANNFGTSLYNGRFPQDATINTAKIFTGTLGTAAGMVGGNTLTNTLIPSIYMNGTDKLLNDANDTHNKSR
ncbi:DUF6443 domain-containing protein [Chryseobacterium sp. YIM B08800]|uniref:DUF6443 domain-containing protein n=1 Tax=Chryseobacterium sp. YIM B08800 TaxID=2984136 RepID=UPI00223F0783|nr:DUF6443 domain-containing protein [Chryseobacterium sp. YIM B08800]